MSIKNKWVNVRLSENDWMNLQIQAAANEMTVSEYVRHGVINKLPVLSITDKKVLEELINLKVVLTRQGNLLKFEISKDEVSPTALAKLRADLGETNKKIEILIKKMIQKV